MDDDTPKIKKFDIKNNSLKELGEVIANENGRKIIIALAEKEMYINQVSNELNIPVSLVLHHVQKLEKLGMLEITEKPISKKTKDHRFFKVKSDIFLNLTPEDDSTKDDSKLKRIFKDGVKFVAVGVAAIFTWFSTKQQIPDSNILLDRSVYVVNKTTSIPQPDITPSYPPFIVDPTIAVSVIIICGLFLIWFSKKYK